MYSNDPLLNYPKLDISDIEKEQYILRQKYEALKNGMWKQKSQLDSPVWDEVDRIVSSLNENEYRYLQNNEEFIQSSSVIQGILQREYMRIMRPIVENTKDGKDALDKHLTLVKRLVKSVKDEAGKREELMNEYITHHSDITWNEFIKIKQEKDKYGRDR